MGFGTRLGNIPELKELRTMNFIKDLREGDRLQDIYLCKSVQAATGKTGKEYFNVVLQDKTGTIDAKIWEPGDSGICDFDKLDYIQVSGDVTSYNGNLQVTIRRVRIASEGEYDPADYLPMSRFKTDEMYQALIGFVDKIKEPHLNALVKSIFVEDEEFIRSFKFSSAAKSVHHNFVGGLLEHTYHVTRMCDYLAKTYTYLNGDLLLTAAMCHDIAKVRELSAYPENDYTDDGQLLGHIVMGYQMVSEYAAKIDGFPPKLLSELLHCILAHHGELEFGSPKKPALAEAIALSFADNTDAKLETMREALENGAGANADGWLGMNRFLDSNIRKTSDKYEG